MSQHMCFVIIIYQLFLFLLFKAMTRHHWRRHGGANGGSCPPNCLQTGSWDYRKFVEKFLGEGEVGARTICMNMFATNWIQISWKCSRRRLAAGLRPDPLGELTCNLLRGGKGGKGRGGEGKVKGRKRGKAFRVQQFSIYTLSLIHISEPTRPY